MRVFDSFSRLAARETLWVVVCGWRFYGVAIFPFFALLLAFGCSSPSVPPPSLAITNVTLIDATGAAPQPNMTVFIADEQIAAIGQSKSMSIPKGHEDC